MVDDFSKHKWVLFLHSKEEARQLIIDHIKNIEVDAKLPMKLIRIDNGMGIKNAVLNDFCTQKGISTKYSTPWDSTT